MSDYTHEYRARPTDRERWSGWQPITADDNGVLKIFLATASYVEVQTYHPRWKTGSYTHKANENTFECLYVDDDGNGYGQLTTEVASGTVTYPDGLDTYSLKDWEKDES